ncbi:MAG: zinc-ribbon domain-containing protein [Planctomycetes bacterium]|nr:zinc-ribbon domain-containing protein [Planctomycetota bacterium]
MIEQNLCPNCNKPVLDTEEICPNCGAIIAVKKSQQPLTKKAIKSKPRNMMASAPRKGTNPRAGKKAVSPRAQTEVNPQRPKKRKRAVSPRVQSEISPQGRPKRRRPSQVGQGQKRRPQSGRQYMHSAPDSDYEDGLSRPTRGQKIEKKTDVTTIVVIAGVILAVIIVLVSLSKSVREEGGHDISSPDHEVVTEEKVDPLTELFRVYSIDNYNPETGIEIILRTDGRLSDSQCKQIISLYQKNLINPVTAIPIVGDEGKFNTWQSNEGKILIIFTRQHENKKFEDYYKQNFTVNIP